MKHTVNVGSGALAFTLIILGITAFIIIASQKVESNIEFSCNSGNIDLDMATERYVEFFDDDTDMYVFSRLAPLEPDFTLKGTSYWKNKLLLKYFNVNNIDNLNCYGNVQIKTPVYFATKWLTS